MKKGDLIQYKKIIGGVRLGGAEPKRIAAVTSGYVVYDVETEGGRFLGQGSISRTMFDRDFEVVPEEGNGMARFIVTVRHTPTGEDEELRVEAEDWVLAAFKAGLYIGTQDDAPLRPSYNTIDEENQIVSIERVTESRTEEWTA